MTLQGALVIDLAALILLLWVLGLVRRGRLYVGYGVMFVLLAVATIVTVSIPRVLGLVTGIVGAVFPASALALIALGAMAFLLVYVLSQLTIVANRLSTLVQELAIQRARDDAAARRSADLPGEPRP